MNVVIVDTDIPPVDIILRSDDFTPPALDISDYIFTLNNIIRTNHSHNLTVCLKEASIPISFYNVNKSNNVLVIEVEQKITTLTLTPGNYNISQLLTELHRVLDEDTVLVGDEKPTFDWSSYTNKLSFKTASNPPAGFKMMKISKVSTCLKLFGFTEKQDHHNSPDTGILSGDTLCDIRGFDAIHVKTDLFTAGNTYSTKKHRHNSLATIPVSGMPYSIIQFRPQNPHMVEVKKPTISTFRLWLEDDDGNKIDFNGMKWTMTLSIFFVKKKLVTTGVAGTNMLGTSNYAGDGFVDNLFALRGYIDEITKEYRNMGQAEKIEKSVIDYSRPPPKSPFLKN